MRWAMRSTGRISLLIPTISRKQASHLHHGRVEYVEDELRRDTEREHQQRDGNDDPFLIAQKIGKSAATFREWTAEERLHRAHEDDGGDEKAERGDGGEGRRHG